jgi:hypothetical protein
MSAYIIVEIEVTDPIGYEGIQNLPAPARCNIRRQICGPEVVRPRCSKAIELKRIVIVESRIYATRQRLGPLVRDYAEPRKMRHRTAKTNMILVDRRPNAAWRLRSRPGKASAGRSHAPSRDKARL